MYKFADVDNDGTVASDDVTIIGKTKPEHTGGFNISGRYKNFDLNANFAYQIGGDVYNANALHDMMGNKDTGFGSARVSELADCWKMYNVDNNGNLYAVTNPDELRALNAGAKYALPYCGDAVTSEFIGDLLICASRTSL